MDANGPPGPPMHYWRYPNGMVHGYTADTAPHRDAVPSEINSQHFLHSQRAAQAHPHAILTADASSQRVQERLDEFTTRLTDFGNFLVTFNNTTIDGLERRLKTFEQAVSEKLLKLENAEISREQRAVSQLDMLSTTVRDAMQSGITGGLKAAFVEHKKMNAELVKNVSDAILPVISSQFNNVSRQLDKHNADMQQVQRSIGILEMWSRATESQIRSIASASTAVDPSTTTLTKAFASFESQVTQRMSESDELREQLAKVVSTARDEAHFGKEDLAMLLKESNRLQLRRTHTVMRELRMLSDAVGVGVGCLAPTRNEEEALKVTSLAERIAELEMGLQEAMEHFRDAEAARDVVSCANHHGASTYAMKNFSDVSTMTSHIAPSVGRNDTLESEAETIFMNAHLSEGSDLEFPEFVKPTLETSGLNGLEVNGAVSRDILASTLVNEPFSDPESRSISSKLHLVDSVCAITPILDIGLDLGLAIKGNDTTDSSVMWAASSSLCDTPIAEDRSVMPPSLPPSTEPPSSSLSNLPMKLKQKLEDACDLNEMSNEARDAMNPGAGNSDPAPKKIMISESPSLDELLVQRRSLSPLTSLDSSDDDESASHEEPQSEKRHARARLPVLAFKSDSSSPARPTRASPRKLIPAATSMEHRRYVCPKGCGARYTHDASLHRHLHKSKCLTSNALNALKLRSGTTQAKSSLTLPSSKKIRIRIKFPADPRQVVVDTKEDSEPLETHGERRQKRAKLSHSTLESAVETAPALGEFQSQTQEKSSSEDTLQTAELLSSCVWPLKTTIDSNEVTDRQFIQCDSCDSFYHFRCAGIIKEDDRLKEGVTFICPPCARIDEVGQPTRYDRKVEIDICSRPDCDWPRTVCDDPEEFFTIEKILGRTPTANPNPLDEDTKFLWLIKWQGYDMSECDWIPRTNMADSQRLTDQFYLSLRKEKTDVKDTETLLLKEALKKLDEAEKKKWRWSLQWDDNP